MYSEDACAAADLEHELVLEQNKGLLMIVLWCYPVRTASFAPQPRRRLVSRMSYRPVRVEFLNPDGPIRRIDRGLTCLVHLLDTLLARVLLKCLLRLPLCTTRQRFNAKQERELAFCTPFVFCKLFNTQSTPYTSQERTYTARTVRLFFPFPS